MGVPNTAHQGFSEKLIIIIVALLAAVIQKGRISNKARFHLEGEGNITTALIKVESALEKQQQCGCFQSVVRQTCIPRQSSNSTQIKVHIKTELIQAVTKQPAILNLAAILRVYLAT